MSQAAPAVYATECPFCGQHCLGQPIPFEGYFVAEFCFGAIRGPSVEELVEKWNRRRNFNYPETTVGSLLAREIRKECNTLSPEERQASYDRALKIINEGKLRLENSP